MERDDRRRNKENLKPVFMVIFFGYFIVCFYNSLLEFFWCVLKNRFRGKDLSLSPVAFDAAQILLFSSFLLFFVYESTLFTIGSVPYCYPEKERCLSMKLSVCLWVVIDISAWSCRSDALQTHMHALMGKFKLFSTPKNRFSNPPKTRIKVKRRDERRFGMKKRVNFDQLWI